MGKPAVFSMRWRTCLDGKFLHLRFRNAQLVDGAERTVYRVLGESALEVVDFVETDNGEHAFASARYAWMAGEGPR